MSPLSSLTGLAEAIRPLVETLKKMTTPLGDLRTWAEDRIDRAMTCPECGHGSAVDPVVRAEQAENCDCTDDYCECNPDALADPTLYGSR